MRSLILSTGLVAAIAAGDTGSGTSAPRNDNCSAVYAFIPPQGGQYLCVDDRRMRLLHPQPLHPQPKIDH